MKSLKSKIFIISTIILIISLFTSCFGKDSHSKKEDKIKIVCTIFPEYDWTRNIIGDNIDNFDLSLIVKNGVDLHSFQPSTADVVKITNADIFIYVGGASDNWVTDVLANSKNPKMKVINLMEVLDDRVQEKEIPEGMEACLDHNHNHSHEDKVNSTDFDNLQFKHSYNTPIYDEHIWLSLQNAEICCTEITKAICTTNTNLAMYVNQNLSSYIKELRSLDERYKTTITDAKEKTIIVCDRFPFRYLVEDYGLNYYAAFSGCSAETEASFETIAFLSHKLQQTGLNAVLTIDHSDNKIANTVIQNAKRPNTKILTLNSMQSTTLEDALNGQTYVKIMETNLEALKEALK